MWKKTLGPEHNPPDLPPILEEDEIVNLPDITLKDDLLILEDDLMNNASPPPENPPADQPAPLHVIVPDTVAKVPAKENEATFYIKECPANLDAGAVWGEEVPDFENLLKEQRENGSSRWGPFEDEDEWDLAKWLIRNVGHNQTDSFFFKLEHSRFLPF